MNDSSTKQEMNNIKFIKFYGRHKFVLDETSTQDSWALLYDLGYLLKSSFFRFLRRLSFLWNQKLTTLKKVLPVQSSQNSNITPCSIHISLSPNLGLPPYELPFAFNKCDAVFKTFVLSTSFTHAVFFTYVCEEGINRLVC
jgi:hypothetical protein